MLTASNDSSNAKAYWRARFSRCYLCRPALVWRFTRYAYSAAAVAASAAAVAAAVLVAAAVAHRLVMLRL